MTHKFVKCSIFFELTFEKKKNRSNITEDVLEIREETKART